MQPKFLSYGISKRNHTYLATSSQHITSPRTLTQRHQVPGVITTHGELGRDSHASLTNYRQEDSFAISLSIKFKSVLIT
jgi:hypothetical protein